MLHTIYDAVKMLTLLCSWKSNQRLVAFHAHSKTSLIHLFMVVNHIIMLYHSLQGHKDRAEENMRFVEENLHLQTFAKLLEHGCK